MLDNLLEAITFTDWSIFAIALTLSIGVIFLIRARQVRRYRHDFGYDIYTTDIQSRRLMRWASLALVSVITIAGIYVWQVIHSGGSANIDLVPPSQDADPLFDMTLVIPKLGVEARVVEAPIIVHQWDISRLTDEVAHLEGTAYPGQPGNAALVGHITIPGAGWGPFKDLGMLQPGDHVFIQIGAETITYEVTEKKTVDADTVEVIFPTRNTRLTLLTCTGWDGSLQHYTQRMVVVAQLIP